MFSVRKSFTLREWFQWCEKAFEKQFNWFIIFSNHVRMQQKSPFKAHSYSIVGVYVIRLDVWSQRGTRFMIDGPEGTADHLQKCWMCTVWVGHFIINGWGDWTTHRRSSRSNSERTKVGEFRGWCGDKSWRRRQKWWKVCKKARNDEAGEDKRLLLTEKNDYYATL